MQVFTLNIIFSLLILLGQGERRANFGEKCNSTLRCSSSAWLTCRNETCDCVQPKAMIFREEINTCVVKSGERCKFEIEGTNLIEIAGCVESAQCSSRGLCVCHDDFFENEEQTCSSKKLFDEPCNHNDECFSKPGLTCIDGKCDCSSNATQYSHSHHQCIGLIGKPCVNSKCIDTSVCSSLNICTCPRNKYTHTLNDQTMTCLPKKSHGELCTSDDECSSSYSVPLTCLSNRCECPNNQIFNSRHNRCVGKINTPCNGDRSCPEHAKCIRVAQPDGTKADLCRCSSDRHKASSDGTCKLDHDERCFSSDECSDGLECIDSECQCPYISLQRYDGEKCLSPVEAPCVNNTTCDVHSYCSLFKDSQVGLCKCEEGFSEDSDRRCKASFESKCERSYECNELAGLKCIDGQCKCPSYLFQKFDANLQVCVGLVGAVCEDKRWGWHCTENAECATKLSLPRDNLCSHAAHAFAGKRCRCKEGFAPNRFFECVPDIRENLMDKLVSVLASKSNDLLDD